MAIELKDLAGLSEPIKKLIEVCAEGIGAVARPWLMRRDAKALAASQVTLKQAQLEISSANLPSMDVQVAAMVEYREAKRLSNLHSVVSNAKKSLPEKVAEEPLDTDWIGRFFSYAQDVSNEEMQELWGKLLSGEVSRPGSFSLRTLDVVRNLSSAEANTFSRLSRYSLNSNFFISPRGIISRFKKGPYEYEIGHEGEGWSDFYQRNGISPQDFTLLEEIQLLNQPIGTRTWEVTEPSKPLLLEVRGCQGIAIFHISPNDNPWKLTMPSYDLSHIARELAHLAEPTEIPNELISQLDSVLQQYGLGCRLAIMVAELENGKKQWRIDD